MILSELIKIADLNSSDFSAQQLNLDVKDLTSDSRQVKAGSVFFALHGVKTDGAKFIAMAIEKGAIAVVVDFDSGLSSSDIVVIKTANARALLAKASAYYFENQPKIMVAVTGTAGKTSVAAFVQQIWAYEGLNAAMVGTTGVVSNLRKGYGSLTTPDPVTLHKLLSDLYHDGVTHCAMEASSHGLDQFRLDGVELAAGAFTNLGRDHMDYHPTVEHYLGAKMALFERVLPKGAPAIIYADDEWSSKAIETATNAGNQVLTVGRKGDYLTLKRVEQQKFQQRAEVHFKDQIFEVNLPLAGDFQMANALVAAGLCISTGSDVGVVMKALDHIKGAPGRLDLVGTTKSGAPVYVDYAHKPDALEHVLKAVRPFTTGRIVLAFGCGGDRDKGKRAIMGDVAARLADIVIVTDDNPRTEDGPTIRAEILEHVPKALEIGDRSEAIETAIEILEEGDTLIIAGKGHEHGQIVGDVVMPFSDHEEARAVLEL